MTGAQPAARSTSISRMRVRALKPFSTCPKNRCFMLSNRDRADAFAAPAAAPEPSSVMPVASSAA